VALVDEDSRAFEVVMAAYALPKVTQEERSARADAIQAATRGAIDVPLRTMRAALRSMDVLKAMAEMGNPNAVSDAGAGALCARAAVRAAYLNVKINVGSLTDAEYAEQVIAEGATLEAQAQVEEAEVMAAVQAIVDGP
jgi:glutamate formiminotransferase/formiminotetrahydrofolate cyclodeaminase